MSTPVPIQFAFQGGGAKIVALLAVAEAIQDFERHGKIRVTGAAGTSAGSIVAAFVAARIPASQIMAALKAGKGRELLEPCQMPSMAKIVWKLLRGQPLWNSAPLRAWLHYQFKAVGIVRVEDASKSMPLTITKTNLGSRASVSAQPSEILADALVDSCALPYLFRVWNSNGTPVFVDGGIANNLPASYLAGSLPKGDELIAVSFADVATDHPDGFKSFSLSLLDTAMSSTMDLIKQAHASNLLEISTTLGTFDFDRAISTDFDESYAGIREWAKRELQGRIDKIHEASRVSIADPWKETNPTARHMMEVVGKAYSRSLATTPLRYDRCRLTVYSNQGRPVSDPYASTPDRAVFEFVFHSGAVPTYCISAGLVGQSSATFFAADSAYCQVTDPIGNKVGFVKVPARTDEEGTRELCLFFTPPLPPDSGPYTVHFQEDGEGLMADLFATGRDVLGYHPQRPDGPVGLVELFLFVHESIEFDLFSSDMAFPGRAIDCKEVAHPAPAFPGMHGHGLALSNADKPWTINASIVDKRLRIN